MKITHNIIFKCFMLLILAVGWGGSALAQSFPVEGKIYAIKAKFASASDDSYLTNGGSNLTFPNTAVKTGSYWIAERSGNSNFPWRFKSVADNTKFLDPSQSSGLGTSSPNFAVRSCGGGLYNLNGMIGGGDSRTNLNIGTWGYTNAKKGFGRSGNGGCWGTGQSTSGWTTQYDIVEYVLVNGNVTIKTVDSEGNDVAGAELKYTQENGTILNLPISGNTYNFGDVALNVSRFATVGDIYSISSVNYDNSLNVLTFVVSKDPNVLHYSSAPSGSDWASDTQWYSIQNNRSNQTDHNYKYLSTAESSVNDNYTLKASIADLEGNRGEAWAFVGTEDGFQIYNAAYGPAFVLGSSSNTDNANANFKMVLKDSPEGYFTTFTAVPNSVLKSPSTHSYAFRVGTTGNVHVHVTNGTLRTWNHSGAIVGSNSDGGSSFTITAIEDITSLPEYDVYKVETNAGTVSYNGTREVFGKRSTSPYFILAKGDPEITQTDIETSRDIESFSLTTPSETYIKTISLTLSFPHILHRQHAVFNHLYSAAEKPNSKFIQDGDGMIPHPYAANFTDAAGYNENDRTMQNTSVFHITQYTKKGGTTQVRMPYRRERDGSTQNSKYQRWYDYTTERLLEPGIVNLAGFATYANGQAKTSGPLGMTNITLPTTKDEIIVGVDASEFEDYSYDSDGNLIEPSLSMHVVIHVKDAAQMASALTTSGDTWWEEKTYIVPNIKRGSTGHKNNVDLLPLDMPFTNYWIYDNSHNLMRIVEEGGNYNSLANNLVVEVEGSAASLITADIFKNNSDTGIGDPPPVATNHFIYYKVKGSDLTRTIPAGSQAVIKVYARNGVSGTRYQLAKFTLNFEAETEPLAITSVIGNAKSTRSVDYFLKNGMKEVANLTFKEKAANFTAIKGQGVQEGTYAYPLDPTRTSYSYSPNNAFAGYRITKKAYGMKTHPVSLYEQNIKSLDDAPALNIDPDDYYFYVDASEAPGQVASIPLDGNLCRGTKLYFYGWLASQNPCEASATSASVILELLGMKDGQETVLARYAPGVISDVAYNPQGGLVRSVQNGKSASELGAYSYSYNLNGHGDDQTRIAAWQSIGFNYTLSEAGFDGFELRVLNNCFSTAGGDYSLDDFRVFVKTPQVSVDNAAPICGDELSIVRISTDFDALMDALQGTGGGGGTVTYYGTYAILDKEVYDKRLEGIASPTKADVADAFNLALMGEHEKDNCIIDGQFFPELYAFHSIKFYSDYLSHQHITYSMLVGDNILDTAGYMYQYNQTGDIISRNIVFNCKITDERIAGKKYYLVFSANIVPHDMTTIDKADYAEFFSMGDICCVRSEFETMRAQMVKIEGADELDPYGIDYCPGTAPTISLNSYGYDTNGELIQEHGVYYDWYFGTLHDFRQEYVWIDGADIDIEDIDNYTHREILTAEDFCMEHCLLNFRHFYPNAGVTELYDGTVRVHHFEKEDETDAEYELTAKMIAKLKEWVECGKLRLHLTAVSVDLSDHDAMGMTHILAIQQGAKLRYEHADTSKENPIIYCMDPVEISFHTNLESPGASVGLAGVDYSVTPFDRDVAGKGVYHSVPLRVNNVQIRAIREGKKLEVPIRVILPSGYYKVDDGSGLVNTQHIHLDIDEADNDIYVAETNDPQWQLRHIDGGGGEYVPSVGKLLSIDADKDRTTGYDNMVIQFNDATHDNQQRFVPREGFYYLLRTQFTENLNDGVVLAPEYDVPEVKCKGNILIPLKIVPEYMKWTGRESDDWNNDRNWIRADYRELVPSDAQNHSQAYADYATNQPGVADPGRVGYNGLPVSANDNVADDSKKDIYIPMDEPSVSTLYNTFAYAPMTETSVIIPSGLDRYPVVSVHTKTSENLLRLTEAADGTNTPWIAYDMVAERRDDGNYFSDRYYENRIKDITFHPATMMYDAQHLSYQKAWVEYALDTNRWYTIGSPLQETRSGEWFSPTAEGTEAGRELSPLFHDITYDTSLNNRFDPAYYQRSWDKGVAEMYRCYDSSHNPEDYYLSAQNPLNVAVALDWSQVYNDVKVDYSAGGFSVKPVLGSVADAEVLVRLPKADTSYFYYDQGDETLPATHRGDETAITRGAGHYRLFSDKLATASSFTQSITNAGGTSNPYYLVANPLMTPLDMDEFFTENPQFEAGKFWIMHDDLQDVSVKTPQGWLSTSGDNAEGAVAPLQAFFVKLATPSAEAVSVTYTAAMQKVLAVSEAPVLKAPARRAQRSTAGATIADGVLHIAATSADGVLQSQAAVLFSDEATDAFAADEDAELLLDSNTAEYVATVFTAAPSAGSEQAHQALQFNALSRTVRTIPLGLIAPADDTLTTLSFSGVAALADAMDEAPMLYDAANGAYTQLEEGMQLSVTGSSAGRYFIVSGMHLPYDNGSDGDNVETARDLYNLHGIRVASPQHGTVTIRGSRKVYVH